MPINRFYNPTRSQYVSQFVPRQLNAQLMMGVLGSKQQQENQKQAMLESDSQFDFNYIKDAIADKDFHDKTLTEFKQKRDALYGVDITTDTAALRDYKKYVNSLRENENIKKVVNNYEMHNQYLDWKDKTLKDPSKKGIGEGYFTEDMEWMQYKQGEGFKGNYIFGKHTESFDSDSEISKDLGEVKADSRDWYNLPGDGYKYKKGHKGVGMNKLLGVYQANQEQWMNGPVGEHMRKLVLMEKKYSNTDYANLSSEKQQEFNEAVQQKLYDRFRASAQRRIFSETSSDIQAAPEPGYGNTLNQFNTDANLGSVSDQLTPLEVSGEAIAQSFDETQLNIKNGFESLNKILGLGNLTSEQQATLSKLPEHIRNSVNVVYNKELTEAQYKKASAGQTLIPEVLQTNVELFRKKYNQLVADPSVSDEDKEAAYKAFNGLQANVTRLTEDAYLVARRNYLQLKANESKSDVDKLVDQSGWKSSSAISDSRFEDYLREEQILDYSDPNFDPQQHASKGYFIYGTNSTNALQKALDQNIPVEGVSRSGARFNVLQAGDMENIVVGDAPLIYDSQGKPMKVITYVVGKSGTYIDPYTGQLKEDGKEGERKTLLYEQVPGQVGGTNIATLQQEIALSKHIDPSVKTDLITELRANQSVDKNGTHLVPKLKNTEFKKGQPVKINGQAYVDYSEKEPTYKFTNDFTVTLKETTLEQPYYEITVGNETLPNATTKRELWMVIANYLESK
jgi:hypothetical protein